MKLYKYVTLDRLDILRNGMLRFTQPEVFNDPFELSVTFGSVHRSGGNDLEKAARRSSGNLGQILSMMLDETLRITAQGVNRYWSGRVGVLSLAERPDNLLMWAHYAADHRGFVIEFDADHDFFHRQESEDDRFRHLRRVAYSNERPSVAMEEYNAIDALLAKSLDWEYELEWRMILPLSTSDRRIDGGDTPVHLFALPPECVCGVILGCRTTASQRWEMAQFLTEDRRYRHVTMREARLDPEAFRLHLDPSPTLPLARAARALEDDRKAEALGHLDEAIELRPDEPRYVIARAMVHVQMEDWPALKRDLEGLDEYSFWSEEVWALRHTLAERDGDWRSVLDAVDHALERDDPPPELYFQRGFVLLKLEENEAAARALDRYLELRPEDPEGHRRRGQADYRAGDLEAALARVDRAIDLAETPARYRVMRAHLLEDLERVPEALAEMDLVIGEAPEDAGDYGYRAWLHQRSEDTDSAIADLDRALDLEPADVDLRLRRARLLHLARGRRDLAIADLDVVIRERPEDPGAYRVRAHLHRQLGDEAKADSDLETARRLEEALDREPSD